MNKRYLGDGVYAAFDGVMVILTTEDGVSATNTIHLEDTVRAALRAYLEEVEDGRPRV